jgi:hypothetical protein
MTSKAAAIAAMIVTLQCAGAFRSAAHEYQERGRESVQRSFAPSGSGFHRLEVDNVFGSVKVTVHDARTVEVAATRITFARDPADAELAAREVTLDLREENGTVRAYVDGPFRDCRDGRRRAWTRRDYTVRYEFAIEVPRDVTVALRTVNDGDIEVRGVARGFDLENVNGAIEAVDVAGPGRAHTVNGDVRVTFRENPPAASSFASVNGDIAVSLRPGLGADLLLKTFNGNVFTDFDVSALPPVVRTKGERRNGKFVYEGDRSFAVRVGGGGPELSFDAFNGDIRIIQGGR